MKKIIAALALALAFLPAGAAAQTQTPDRDYWVAQLTRVAGPVIRHLSENTLRANIPVGRSSVAQASSREFITHMESVGRTFAGIAPWLELGGDDTPEGRLREEYIQLSLKALANSVDPASPDYFDSHATRQILVNSAFLIHGLLRAPTQLWGRLDTLTRARLVEQWKSTRTMVPGENNWLLFSAMVECGLREFAGEWNFAVVERAITSHQAWYKGDGLYGDGKAFHLDYYNSFVIHPMMLQILDVMKRHDAPGADFYDTHLKRFVRYAAIQERMIAPDGTYPVVGRSITYRLGAFQVLAEAALLHRLPETLSPAATRCALTATIRRQLDFPGTFDANGWLTIGICGEQPELGDVYLSSPCLYLCALVFLPLGLPADDPFWSAPPEEWTSVRAFSGKTIPIDTFLK